jgi:hypothetical protein
VSGDDNMIKVLTEPDLQFARIDAKDEDKVVRIAFNEVSAYPQSVWDEKLVVSESDPRILRNNDGSIIHPKRDVHWELGETIKGLPREKCDKNLDRSGSGKVGNFCLCEGSEIFTKRGKVPIECVAGDDLLWDGDGWRQHEGVVCNGEQMVHFYQGLWATDCHEVFTSKERRKFLFGDARILGLQLKRERRQWKHRDSKMAKVYDILNVGPWHRYLANGILVSNSVPYGSAEANLERLVEANTGRKPPEGTGAKILEAYQSRYPVAWRFLQGMEQIVETPGWYRSVSGRVRHFFFNNLSDVDGLSEYSRNGILSPLTRQARNFPIQELVAATAAKALIRFIKERNEMGLRSKVMMSLYDAISLLSPLEEAKVASELIKNCMTVWTPWTIGERTFSFEADTTFNYRWGVKMTKKEKAGFEKYLV